MAQATPYSYTERKRIRKSFGKRDCGAWDQVPAATDAAWQGQSPVATLLGRVLANERMARAALRIIDGGTWRKQKFVRWMFEDEPRAALFTPSRWHRNFLRRDGAYVTQDQTK